jgi:glycosyltransferase involved in cell wall biosynthesis
MSTNPERIAIFVQDLRGGGAERMMANLAGAMTTLEASVDLVMVRREGQFLSRIPDSVRVVELRSGRVNRSVPAFARYLRRERPAAVLSTLTHVNVAALLARRVARVPTRMVVREANFVSANRKHLEYPLVRFAYRVMPWVYPWADAIVTVSDDVAVDLARFVDVPPGRIITLANPVVTDDLFEAARQPVAHRWLSEGDQPVILAAGRLVPQKDFATLIRAFSEVRKHKAARLIVLGEGPERPVLQALVEELELTTDVVMPGFVENPHAWLSRASVFALSSAWEGSPNVLVEAMACGVPVISTDCPGGCLEILGQGAYGSLVPVGDAGAMASGIRELLDTQADGSRGRERAMDYSARRSAAAYLRVLRGAIPPQLHAAG